MKVSTKIQLSHHDFTKKSSYTFGKNLALFAKKNGWFTLVYLPTCKKTFFWVSKSVKPQLFFFFQLWAFFTQTEKKKHNFHFQIAKNLKFVHPKNQFFIIFTLVQRHLLNLRETVRSFTAVSLKLLWNSKNCQSFTETGCQKYVVFGMKSAKSTVLGGNRVLFFFVVSFTWNWQ